MRQRLKEFIKENNIICVELDNTLKIHLEAHPQNEIIITVPFEVNEWFISVKDQFSGEELFTDWCEHYHSDSSSSVDLNKELQDTVISVIELLNDTEIAIRMNNGVKMFAHQIIKQKQLLVETDIGFIDFWEALELD